MNEPTPETNKWLDVLYKMLEDKLRHHVNQPLNAVAASMMEEECAECIDEFVQIVKDTLPDVVPPKITARVSFEDGDMCIELSTEG